MRSWALLVTILALLAAACDSGGAIGEGSVKDKVPPSAFPAAPQVSPPKLTQLRHDGEVVLERHGGLVAANPTTGHTRKLVACPHIRLCILGPEFWSPDGTMLAYDISTCITYACGLLDGIWVKQAGQTPRQLTSSCSPALTPRCVGEEWAWSPTGDVLAYGRSVPTRCSPPTGPYGFVHCKDRNDQSELSLLDPESGQLTPLMRGRGRISDIAWSPDGTRIAFVDGAGINLISPTGGTHPRVIARGLGFAGSVTWSPDGTHIAFTAFQNSLPRIDIMNADGSDRRALVTGTKREYPDAPVWSPDSTRIAYVSTPRVVQFWVASVDGSSRTKVYEFGAHQHAEPAYDGPVWSPDGARIAFRAVRAGLYNADQASGKDPMWRLAYASGNGRPSRIDPLVVAGWQQRAPSR